MEEFKPKHTIFDSEKFQKGREKIGGLILEGMEATGGTDIDWMIEHRGGFIFLENKEFHENHVSIPLGQMIAFEKLHEKLNSVGKCYFFIFGYDVEVDWKNPDSNIWFFEMTDWKNGKITFEKDTKYKRYLVERKNMKKVAIKEFRELMDVYWKEFEKS